MADSFHDDIVAALPRLRRMALALTHSRIEAEDLVQEVAVAALAARHTFAPGTNFKAWVSTIMRNRFHQDQRRRPKICALDDVPDDLLATSTTPDERIVLEELRRVLSCLTANQRHSLALVAFQGCSYEQAASMTGSAVGTVKSRVFHARRTVLNRLQDKAR